MARMVASFGNVPRQKLIKAFVQMAQGLYETNELNKRYGEFKHDSGWGAVYLDSGTYSMYRSILPCWKDLEIRTLAYPHRDIVILHAQKVSGEADLQATHPLHRWHNGREWYFCHDGAAGDDSERMFCLLLEAFDDRKDIESIRDTIGTLKGYASLNSFLFNGEHLYAISWRIQHPDYHSLNVLESRNRFLLSSEALPELGSKWRRLENRQIVKVSLEPLYMETF